MYGPAGQARRREVALLGDLDRAFSRSPNGPLAPARSVAVGPDPVDERKYQGSGPGAHRREEEGGSSRLEWRMHNDPPEGPAMNVNGKVTVVTGGASLIGLAPSGLGSSNVRPHGPDQAQRQQPPHLY
jgi:hypothetical protein